MRTRRSLIGQSRRFAAATLVSALSATALASITVSPIAEAGPCSEMFGNFGSLLEQQTGAGMADGSNEALGSLDALGSLGSSGSSGSADSSSGSLTSALGSLALSRSGSLIQQLESGSLGNTLTGSLNAASGSVLDLPQWVTGDQGTIPVLTGPTQIIQLLTGPTSPLQTPEKYGVGGTDLGIMWDNADADNPQVLMAFGDTMGDCSIPGNQWRGNVMFRTSDRNLADGMSIDSVLTDSSGLAKEMVPRTNLPGEVTIIPTAAIGVDGVQYLRFMSVSHWGLPGTWDTNYSGLAYSTDNGETWTVNGPSSRPLTDFPAGEGAPPADDKWFNSQMSAFVRGHDDGYVYEYFTPSGRQGAARLARVPDTEMLTPEAYTYWDGSGWSEDISDAEPVLPAWVSELSVKWHPGINKYISMYSSGTDSVLIRTADHPQGPWSRGTVLIDFTMLQGAYGGFIYPWSTGNDLYFVLTAWNAYNVFLAHTDLSKINLPGVDAPTVGDAQTRAAVQAQLAPAADTDRAAGDTTTEEPTADGQEPAPQEVLDATANGPINALDPNDAWDTSAPAITVAETGTQVVRRIAAAEVTVTGGMVPQQ